VRHNLGEQLVHPSREFGIRDPALGIDAGVDVRDGELRLDDVRPGGRPVSDLLRIRPDDDAAS
jgi:hypothetical protein